MSEMGTDPQTSRPVGDAPGQAAAPTRGRPAYTRLQVAGLVTIGSTALLVAVASIATSPPDLDWTVEILVFFGPVALGCLVASWLAWRFGTWARVVGLLVAIAVAALLGWTVLLIPHVHSVVEFTLGAGVTVGVVMALAGGVAVLVSTHRKRVEMAPTTGERVFLRGALVVLGISVGISVVLSVVGRTTVDADVAAGATQVEMAVFAFEPREIRVDGRDARLVVRNRDAFLHDIAVPAIGADPIQVTPGSQVLVDLSGTAPGTYVVYCTLHSDTSASEPAEDDMTGVLVVR
jgi:plastocyanin